MKPVLALLLCSLAVPAMLVAQAAPSQATSPEAASADKPLAEVSADAEPVLAQMEAAYKGLERLKLTGTLSGDFDVQGEQSSEQQQFTASYQAPALFRHEMAGEVAIGSTGELIFIHGVADRIYDTAGVPAQKGPLSDLPPAVQQILAVQNPSLMLAVSDDPRKELIEDAKTLTLGDSAEIDGKRHDTLIVTTPSDDTITLRIDPQTHLVRQAVYDLRGMIQGAGAVDVKKASMTVDYSAVQPDAELEADHFAWTPPADARNLAEVRAQQQEEMNAPSPLEGKPAPDFTLKTLEGEEEITLSDLKGEVVLLDFWATWCGPCVASMPHLEALNGQYAEQGLKLFAVNLKEDPAKVKQFMADKGLSLRVLLDPDSAVFQNYQGTAIPYQVLIGRDGVIRRVSTGLSPDGSGERALEEAIKAALAEQ